MGILIFVMAVMPLAGSYNMHLMPKYLLIEAGAQTNTVKEMQRSMKVLADLLDVVVDP